MGQRTRRQEDPHRGLETILKIPVLPISYGDAAPILRQLKGKVVPNEWKGALPFTYHVGPGPAQVHMNLRFEWKNRPLYNVVARIPGTTRPTSGSFSAITMMRG